MNHSLYFWTKCVFLIDLKKLIIKMFRSMCPMGTLGSSPLALLSRVVRFSASRVSDPSPRGTSKPLRSPFEAPSNPPAPFQATFEAPLKVPPKGGLQTLHRFLVQSFDAPWMESCTRWLVAEISHLSSSTVRGVATCPTVSSAWTTAAIPTWEGSGQSAQSRGCIGSIGSRRCGGEDGRQSLVGACQGREESGTVESASPLEPRRSSGTCPVQGETFRGGVEGNGRHGRFEDRQAPQERPLASQMSDAEDSLSVQNVDWRRSMRNAQQSRFTSTTHAVV